MKQFVGLTLGVSFGISGAQGAPAVVSFFTANLVCCYFVYARLMRADLELLGPEGQLELVKEGGMASLATFVLSWSTLFTFLHV